MVRIAVSNSTSYIGDLPKRQHPNPVPILFAKLAIKREQEIVKNLKSRVCLGGGGTCRSGCSLTWLSLYEKCFLARSWAVRAFRVSFMYSSIAISFGLRVSSMYFSDACSAWVSGSRKRFRRAHLPLSTHVCHHSPEFQNGWHPTRTWNKTCDHPTGIYTAPPQLNPTPFRCLPPKETVRGNSF